MPKKQKPKWDHRLRQLGKDDGVRVYSDEDIIGLAERYDISCPEQVKRLKLSLEGAAYVYRTWLHNWSEAPRAGEIDAALKEVQSLADDLFGRLQSLDDLSAKLLWMPDTKVSTYVYDDEVSQSEYGHTIQRWTDETGNTHVSYLDREDILEALKILSAYCEEAREGLPEDRGGAKANHALRLWAMSIEKLWENVLRRQFSRDEHQGKAVSEAARFCVDAFKYVDPDVEESKILWAMRQVIDARPEQTAGDNPPRE